MSATIYDLAEAAGVSISTVSKALNDSYSISEKTKKRIREIADSMGYKPNARARSFARRKNGIILFAADLSRGVGFENPHMFEIVTGVDRYLDEKGYSLILKHVTKDAAPESVKELMLSEEADGIIIHAGILTKQLAFVLGKEQYPHLIIGKPDFANTLSWIDVSHESAGQIAANYLLDKGYRRIVFLMGDAKEDQISLRRLDGINMVFEEEELSIETIAGITNYEESRVIAEEILRRDQIPEVILCTNNYLAMGCMQSIRTEKLSIPEDIAIMTFDNYPFSMLTVPTLTAIEVDMYDMGNQAARFMLQKIKKPNLQTQSFCTTPILLEREST
ncbi:MAG: LacI family DNA-binding transcriptional regulator [Butyrivibrio sp.]|jgi:DNA-binding LacI/PurR family transcriptional regulator|nr:LacI family DNA-binding transcriptional regulator [Butyrivibrio sp.]